jgi:hypothetical protein
MSILENIVNFAYGLAELVVIEGACIGAGAGIGYSVDYVLDHNHKKVAVVGGVIGGALGLSPAINAFYRDAFGIEMNFNTVNVINWGDILKTGVDYLSTH